MSVERGDGYVYIDHGDRLLRIRRSWNGEKHRASYMIDLFTSDGRANFWTVGDEAESTALEQLFNGEK